MGTTRRSEEAGVEEEAAVVNFSHPGTTRWDVSRRAEAGCGVRRG
jgi:hypothetical protein